MSEAATQSRAVKRGWARPGAAHDRLIGVMKIALPALIGIVLAFLVFSPLEDKQEVSFLLKKEEVDRAEERMRVQAAQYRGQDNRGRPFVLNAQRALQRSASQPIVEIGGMSAEMNLENGPARIEAGRARYNIQQEQVQVIGPILLTGADGYRMVTHDVAVDLHNRRLASQGRVEGQMPLGRFSGGRLEADLGTRTVVLTGRPRLHIVQGALR
ncbi:MAG: LPS export ABC transporter periplasmic protein LptC [Sphingomonas sp.]